MAWDITLLYLGWEYDGKKRYEEYQKTGRGASKETRQEAQKSGSFACGIYVLSLNGRLDCFRACGAKAKRHVHTRAPDCIHSCLEV